MTGKQPFTAGIVQFDVAKGNLNKNIKMAFKGLEKLSGDGVSLAVLPEMFSCGFDNDNLKIHAQESDKVVEKLSGFAKQHRMIIAGSLPENESGNIFNTMVLIDRDGSIAASYRKTHLFKLTDEHHYYTPGDAITLADTSLGKIGMMICYDLRFPELCRQLAREGAFMVIVAAQWPTPRKEHWEVLNRARAIENQIFIVCTNRTGSDKDLDFPGCSMVIDPTGNILAHAGSNKNAIAAPVDRAVMETAREQIPCMTDRRADLYG